MKKLPIKTPKTRSRKNDIFAEHRHWLLEAEKIASATLNEGGSPHPTVKVGAVLVDARGKKIAAGANRFAAGIDRRRPARYQSGSKSLWINCAEQMVLAAALRQRAKVKDSTLYVTLEPCAVCAGMIAEVGIRQVCVPVNALRRYARLKAKWKHSIEVGLIKLAETGVRLIAVDRG